MSHAFFLLNILPFVCRLLMAVLLKHLDLGQVAAHIVEYGLSESGARLGLPRSIANVCKAVYETKRALIKVNIKNNVAGYLYIKFAKCFCSVNPVQICNFFLVQLHSLSMSLYVPPISHCVHTTYYTTCTPPDVSACTIRQCIYMYYQKDPCP